MIICFVHIYTISMVIMITWNLQDALRLYLVNSPVVRAENLQFKKNGVYNVVSGSFYHDLFAMWTVCDVCFNILFLLPFLFCLSRSKMSSFHGITHIDSSFKMQKGLRLRVLHLLFQCIMKPFKSL